VVEDDISSLLVASRRRVIDGWAPGHDEPDGDGSGGQDRRRGHERDIEPGHGRRDTMLAGPDPARR
jgi:hypothetical protein